MGMRILIVEDDLLLAEAINDFFTLKGWQTGEAHDGNEALETVERCVPAGRDAARKRRILCMQEDKTVQRRPGVLYHGKGAGGG